MPSQPHVGAIADGEGETEVDYLCPPNQPLSPMCATLSAHPCQNDHVVIAANSFHNPKPRDEPQGRENGRDGQDNDCHRQDGGTAVF